MMDKKKKLLNDLKRNIWIGIGPMLIGFFLITEAMATPIFINEIHYDNTGTDTMEFIEIAGPSGVSLSGWSLVLYNGATGQSYANWILPTSFNISNQQNGFGAVSLLLPTNGLQNGSPDGIALVDLGNNVVQFLSYEGSFSAIGGVANGLTSTDIGVAETASTPVSYSLQLVGTGSVYQDFTWSGPLQNTLSAINTGQTFVTASVPEPASILLFTAGLIGWGVMRKKFRVSEK